MSERILTGNQILPGKRPRKNESTLTTYACPEPGLVGTGELTRFSMAKATDELQEDGLERQGADDKALALDGFYVSHSFCDPDHSASKYDVLRPGLEAALTALEERVIRGLTCGDIDRVTRLGPVIERLCELYRLNEVAYRKGHEAQLYWWVRQDPTDERAPVDLRHEDGREEARRRVASARHESRQTSIRVTKQHAQAQAKGKIRGARGYGFETNGQLRKPEVDVIKALAEVVDKGQNLQGFIDTQLTAKGILGKSGSPFTARTAKGILTSPRLIGLRVDKSRSDLIARDSAGDPIKLRTGVRVLEDDQWLRIQARYKAREVGSGTYRKYLGTGSLVITCHDKGMCGQWDNELNRHFYRCRCGAGIHGPKADEVIRDRVGLRLSLNTPHVAEPAPWPLQAELDAIEARRVAKKALKDAGTLALGLWLDLDEQLATEAHELKVKRGQWARSHPVLTVVPHADLLAKWKSGDVSQERDVVRTLYRTILVTPGPVFSADRMTFIANEAYA